MKLMILADSPNDNDGNIFIFIFLLALALALLGYIIYALKKGAMVVPRSKYGGQYRYERAKAPFGFWVSIATYFFAVGGFLYAAYEIWQMGFGTLFK